MKRLLLCFLLLTVTSVFADTATTPKPAPVDNPAYASTQDALDQPLLKDQQIAQQASFAAISVFNYDYNNYRKAYQDASKYFSVRAWRSFQEASRKSGNLSAVLERKMTASAIVTTTPDIIEKKVIDGAFTWTVKLNVLVTYKNSEDKMNVPLVVTLTIKRVSKAISADGIVVDQYVETSGLPKA